MKTALTTSDPRCKPVPFAVSGMVKPKAPPGEILSFEQIKKCLENKVPPIAKAAKLLYPHLNQLSATAKLHGKIKYAGSRRSLTEQEHLELSAIIISLRKF